MYLQARDAGKPHDTVDELGAVAGYRRAIIQAVAPP